MVADISCLCHIMLFAREIVKDTEGGRVKDLKTKTILLQACDENIQSQGISGRCASGMCCCFFMWLCKMAPKNKTVLVHFI